MNYSSQSMFWSIPMIYSMRKMFLGQQNTYMHLCIKCLINYYRNLLWWWLQIRAIVQFLSQLGARRGWLNCCQEIHKIISFKSHWSKGHLIMFLISPLASPRKFLCLHLSSSSIYLPPTPPQLSQDPYKLQYFKSLPSEHLHGK